MTTRWMPVAFLALTACGEPTTPMKQADLRQISAGVDHSCAMVSSGGVACWGSNDEGQLGLPGGTANVPVISHLEPLKVRHIATGNLASCALATSGQVYCWGNSKGPRVPAGLPALATLSASAVGCGTTGDGQGWCWALPTGDAFRIEGGPWRQVVAGGDQNCALDADSLASCWAQGSSTPTLAPGGHRFANLVVGRAHACGIDGDGAVWCWGANNRGQLGDNSTVARTTPVTLFASGIPDPTFVSLTAGADHNCGIVTSGVAYCWGRDDVGQTGNGGPPPASNNYWSVPVDVTGGQSWRSLSAGAQHTCGLTTSATPFCWGGNDLGQLGTGDRTPTTSPLEVTWSF